LVHAFEKTDKFLMSMLPHAVADDVAIKKVQGGKQSGRAMTLEVVRHRAAGARFQRQPSRA
jgi:dihydroxyacetone kinase